MNRGIIATAGVALLLSAHGVCAAQEREDRTLLDMDAMRAIINEASGERAMHHIMEFVPYVRVRPIDEYKGHFRESEAMANFAKQYGYSTAEIESYPTTNVRLDTRDCQHCIASLRPTASILPWIRFLYDGVRLGVEPLDRNNDPTKPSRQRRFIISATLPYNIRNARWARERGELPGMPHYGTPPPYSTAPSRGRRTAA